MKLKINVSHLQEDKGNYGTLTTGTATVQWRDVKVYKDGTAPN